MLTFRSVAALLFIHTIVSTGLSETHRFEPKVFYNTFSGAHPVALRIKPGDQVNTYTIDAGGRDATGAQRGRGPNPQNRTFLYRRCGGRRHACRPSAAPRDEPQHGLLGFASSAVQRRSGFSAD